MDAACKRNEKYDLAIAALQTTKTVKDAAAIVGVDEHTLARWKREPAFAYAYDTARGQVRDAVFARMDRLVGKAIACLEKSFEDPEAPGVVPPAVAVKVVMDYLERAFGTPGSLVSEAREAQLGRAGEG